MHSTALRAQLESALGDRASSPFTDLEQRVWNRIPSGIAALDAALGGLPRGAITEICGDPCSGRTSIALSVLAEMSSRDETCALVDGTDAFDPESGATAGIELSRLLWIRCRSIDQVLRSTDLLLQGGGFGLIAVDLSDLPLKAVRGVPLASWFRFQRTIENTPTILLIIGRESAAKSAAALVLGTGGIASLASRNFQEGTIAIQVLRTRRSETRTPRFQHHVRLYSCSGLHG
jgi:hypothetical protein